MSAYSPVQPCAFVYEQSVPVAWRQPGLMIIGGRTNIYLDSSFQAAAAAGCPVLIYFNIVVAHKYGKYHELLYPGTAGSGHAILYNGNYRRTTLGTTYPFADNRVQATKDRVADVAAQVFDELPWVTGLFADDLGSGKGQVNTSPSLWTTQERIDFYDSAVAGAQVLRDVCDDYGKICIHNATWSGHSNTGNSITDPNRGGGYPLPNSHGCSLADGGTIEHHDAEIGANPGVYFWDYFIGEPGVGAPPVQWGREGLHIAIADNQAGVEKWRTRQNIAYATPQPDGDSYTLVPSATPWGPSHEVDLGVNTSPPPPEDIPSLRSLGTFATTINRGETINVLPPDQYEAGDVLILTTYLTQRTNTSSEANTDTHSAPAGWNLIAGGFTNSPSGTSGRGRIAVYWKRATASESPVPITLGNTAANPGSSLLYGRMAAYEKCAQTGTPVEAGVFRNGGVVQVFAVAGITTLSTDRLVCVSVLSVDNRSGGLTDLVATNPATFTERFDDAQTIGSRGQFILADGAKEAAGDTGTVQGTFGDIDPTAVVLFALLPQSEANDASSDGVMEFSGNYTMSADADQWAGSGTFEMVGNTPTGSLEGNPTADVSMDPFWRPWAVGNGRIWLRGVVNTVTEPFDKIQYRVNGSDWVTALSDVEPGDTITFPITGDRPSAWGSENLVVIQVNDHHFEAPVDYEPKFVWINNARVSKAELAELDGTRDGWFYDPTSGMLTVGTVGDVLPSSVVSVYDPVFLPGYTYNVQVRANSELPNVLFDQTFDWIYTTRDMVTRYRRVILPTALQDDEFFQSLYTAYAKKTADALVFFEDISAQFYPQFATWSLNMWERQVGLATYPTVSIKDRRAAILARRRVGSTKEEFFKNVLALVPGSDLEIIEDYENFTVNLRLPVSSNNPEIRRSLEALISKIKPAGIRVVVNYSGFFADISEAGDIL